MKQLQTTGIVLQRTNYGEADRIITLLTPDQGKLRLMARGVRRIKSKLAGGIELFSVSEVTYIEGRGEIGTMISTRLKKHYGTIVKDIDRVQLGYDLIKQLHKATEDNPEAQYFELLEQAFSALDDPQIDLELIRTWFQAQLLQLGGHNPNLKTEASGTPLRAGERYNFDFEAVAFTLHSEGRFTQDHIKTLRLLFSPHTIQNISKVQGVAQYLADLIPLIQTMLTSYIRV